MRMPASYTEEQHEAISEWRHESVPHEMIYQDVKSGGVATAYALIVDQSGAPPMSVIKLTIETDGNIQQVDGSISWPDEAYEDEPSPEQERAWNEMHPT